MTMTSSQPKSVFSDPGNLWTYYKATLAFRHRLLGGIPKSPEQIEQWLRHKMFGGDAEAVELQAHVKRTMEEMGVEEVDFDDVSDIAKKMADLKGNGFKRDDDGLYIEARNVKAMLKESVKILYPGGTGRDAHKWGPTKKAPGALTAERIFVEPDRIHFGVEEEDGRELIITRNRMGASSLNLVDYVEKPTIEFYVASAEDQIDAEKWARIWSHAERNGLGASRSQGFGQFVVTAWEQIDELPEL